MGKICKASREQYAYKALLILSLKLSLT